MSDGIRIGKYGLNPTMPVCFWCGEETGEIALLGQVKDKYGMEIEAPKHMCVGYEPCKKCQETMNKGTTLIEATREPNKTSNMEIQKGVYPTGRWMVMRKEAAKRIFGTTDDKLFIDAEVYDYLQEG